MQCHILTPATSSCPLSACPACPARSRGEPVEGLPAANERPRPHCVLGSEGRWVKSIEHLVLGLLTADFRPPSSGLCCPRAVTMSLRGAPAFRGPAYRTGRLPKGQGTRIWDSLCHTSNSGPVFRSHSRRSGGVPSDTVADAERSRPFS
jgi:hypothetical protein